VGGSMSQKGEKLCPDSELPDQGVLLEMDGIELISSCKEVQMS